MKTLLIYSLVIMGTLASRGLASADHDKACKNVHGRVTVITEDGISVDDKVYKISKTTRLTKGEKVVKLSQITPGDLVCVDTRGKDEIGDAGVAAVTVLAFSDTPPVREKEYVREKETVRKVAHDKTCDHIHGRVTRVQDSVLIVDGKPYPCRETTRIMKGDKKVMIETVKAGDFVCIDAGDNKSEIRKVTEVTVLSPSEAAPFVEREVIREREKVKERIPEQK